MNNTPFVRLFASATAGFLLATCAVASPARAESAAADSQYGRQQPDGRQQPVRASINVRQVQQILTRIQTDALTLRRAIEQTGPQGRAVGNTRAAQRDDTLYLVDDLTQAAADLRGRVGRNQASADDLNDFLSHASSLERAAGNNQFGVTARNAWTRLRTDIDSLASAYSVAWDWRNPQYNWGQAGATARQLRGTYRLSVADSDDPRSIANRALTNVSAADRTRIQRQLENRLTPPDVISIERDNTRVTMASSRGPQMTFEADGQARAEQTANGRQITTRASAYADRVEVTTTGSGGSDFSVTFEPLDNGQSLQVTRRLYNDSLRTPITVRSLYRRSSPTADWNVYDGSTRRNASNGRNDSTIVPTGTTFVARLDRPLNLRTAREGDRIQLSITDAPAEFQGGVIEGYVTSSPTRVNNRTGLSIDFDSIRTRNGRSSDFSGTIDRVRDANGRDLGLDRVEGIDNDNKTDQAIQRGAIGAALGAIIGAVVGGGKGAAIGAAVGAGGGAGTVLIDGQSQNELPSGTEFTIRSGTFELR